jgi:hypothetical protein
MSDFSSDREFWIAIRAALLLFVDAIERRYKIGKHAGNQSARSENHDKMLYNVIVPDGTEKD